MTAASAWNTSGEYNTVALVYEVGPVRVSVFHEGPPYKVTANVPIRYDENNRTIYFIPPKE